jgi:hypothetical protein
MSGYPTNFSIDGPSEDLSTPIIAPVIDVHTINSDSTYKRPSAFDIFLVSSKKSPGYTEGDYLPLNAISPYHLAVKQEKKTWVIENYGQFRGYGHPGRVKITTGTAVHLADIELGRHTLGFKMPHLLGIVGQLRSREPGYHTFYLDIHLFSKASKIFPTNHTCAHIAVPSRYIHTYNFSDAYTESTLGQRVNTADEGQSSIVLPPLCAWEVDMDWVLPDKKEIEDWYAQQQEKMGNIWSESTLDYGHWISQ